MSALLLADAGPADGLGHLSRLSALAVALRSRGIETICQANGSSSPLERDGVAWAPWSTGGPVPSGVDVLVLDSYRLTPKQVTSANVPLVIFRDHDGDEADTALVVSVAAAPSDDPTRLSGPRYAALRPAYWGLPPKDTSGPLRSVLVTTGGGDPDGIGAEVARAIASHIREVRVTLVRGRDAPTSSVGGVRLLDAPESLFEEQLAADLVICGGGQTMLESAACGTPCISLVLAENQREQALRLASTGAVVFVDPPDVNGVLAAVRAVGAAGRDELSRRAQDAVDGNGALRIAYHVESLLARTE
jgi:spore coat polysaccharide biosynthesis predicted glycosyltransferase SpsG